MVSSNHMSVNILNTISSFNMHNKIVMEFHVLK